MNKKQGLIQIFFVCTLFGCGGGSDSPKSDVATDSTSTKITMPILLSYANNAKQVGELRLPQRVDDKPIPLVIIIHGGCWAASYADYHFMDKFAQAVTALGYATWNIEYRAIGTGGEWPVIFQDINLAVDHVRNLAQQYPVDVNNVAIIGHSAGGHLALWAANRQTIPSGSDLFTPNPLKIKGVISLAGIANLTRNTGCNTLASNIIGLPVNLPSDALVQRLQMTSPLQMLPSKTKTILVSGAADNIVPAAIGAEYASKAIELKDDSAHYILQGLSHFDLIDPSKTDWSLYQEKLQEIFKSVKTQ